MSKEFAQTLGGKKIGLLLILLAAIAVSLGVWQSQVAKADVTSSPTLVQAPTGNVAVGATITYTATAPVTVGAATGTISISLPSGVTSTGATCTFTGGGVGTITNAAANPCQTTAVTTAGTIQLVVTATVNNAANGTVIAGATATAVGTSTTTTAATAGNTVLGATAAGGSAVAGNASSVTFTLPAGITFCSDATAAGANPRTAPTTGATSASDISVPAPATIGTVVQTPSPANNNAQAVYTVPVTTTANATVTASTHAAGAAAGVGCSTVSATAAVVTPVLRSIADNGTVLGTRDINFNVRGSLHTVCATDGAGNGQVTPALTASIQSSGGYAGTQLAGAQTPNVVNLTYTTMTVTNPNGGGTSSASCFTWDSTGAGDQTISATYVGAADAAVHTVQYTPIASTSPLVKEWNVLETSTVAWTDAVSGNSGPINNTAGAGSVTTAGATITIPLSLNGATGYSGNPVTITDTFAGSHTDSSNAQQTPSSLAGVNWTISALSATSCGSLSTGSGATGTTTLISTDTAGDAGVGNTPSTIFNPAGGSPCAPGSTASLTITGSEGSLMSGNGLTVTQNINIVFTQPTIPTKQILLAWAGQRVIVEHDWRTPPGDPMDLGVTGNLGEPGVCPFPAGNADITYIRGSGPGNFLPGLNAQISGNDQADVFLTGFNDGQADNSQIADAIQDPQDACISRVLYESEDQGEVDIEAFWNPAQRVQSLPGTVNVSKVAFVIYYMQLNTVNVSLVNQVTKPTHNSTSSDYAPGNPWDATKDATGNTADWNVSTDLLVRGRVTGWFTNGQPSGRAQDSTNPGYVLPANRWVMPDDWANLAGGSAVAQAFRPSYDLMFAPNNASLIALTSPSGNSAAGAGASVISVGLTTAAASIGGGVYSATPILNSPIKVNTLGLLPVGTHFAFASAPTTTYTVAANSGGTNLYVTPPLLAAVPAATPLLVFSGVPFEGPYSLIDIPGIAALNGNNAGAALSNCAAANPICNLNASATRDTTQGDGVVDWWDAPMPPAMVSVSIRGTGFIKQVRKQDVYYIGTPNTASQLYPDPYYIQDIPGSPYIPANVVGGGYLWDSWGMDGPAAAGGIGSSNFPAANAGLVGKGPYLFWQPVVVGTNSAGVGDASVTATQATELGLIQQAYGDTTIARDLVVYSDNHGEFMVTANGDFKTDLSACATNSLGGGQQCANGDKVGAGAVSAVADYPDFRGKWAPVVSNTATINWTWGGYKSVTVNPDPNNQQFSYVVFHAMDRDGFCSNLASNAVLLHSALTRIDAASPVGSSAAIGNQVETVDFLIDSGQGIVLANSGQPWGYTGTGTAINDGKQFATGVPTYSLAEETANATGKLMFPVDPANAASGQTDECQAWIKVSNSLLSQSDVLVIAHDDEGNIGFDRVIDFTGTQSYTLNFRWTLVTWNGADAIPVADALSGGATTKNPQGNDISSSVTAVYGWNSTTQTWLGYFPAGASVPGANNLTTLSNGSAYWIAITGPSSVTWTITTNVS